MSESETMRAALSTIASSEPNNFDAAMLRAIASSALSAPPDTSALDRAYAALKPFADYASAVSPEWSDDATTAIWHGSMAMLTLGHCRRAREVAEELRRLGAKEER